MQQPDLRKMIGTGWTYCPRCDKEGMAPTGDGGWACPWCSIKMAMRKQPATDFMMWSEPLNVEELTREVVHVGQMVLAYASTEALKPPEVPPRRVWAFIRVVRPIAWLFSCKVAGVIDKKYKEVTNEQKEGH